MGRGIEMPETLQPANLLAVRLLFENRFETSPKRGYKPDFEFRRIVQLTIVQCLLKLSVCGVPLEVRGVFGPFEK